jgi:hypothetical protein
MRSYTVFQFAQRAIENCSACHACHRLPTPVLVLSLNAAGFNTWAYTRTEWVDKHFLVYT